MITMRGESCLFSMNSGIASVFFFSGLSPLFALSLGVPAAYVCLKIENGPNTPSLVRECSANSDLNAGFA